jgi:predicted nucleic acid-binding protein
MICSLSVSPNLTIKETAKEIMDKCNIRVKDALHLACAIYSKSDFFITCDDKLIKKINNNEENLQQIIGVTKMMNPVDFLRKELSFDDFE